MINAVGLERRQLGSSRTRVVLAIGLAFLIGSTAGLASRSGTDDQHAVMELEREWLNAYDAATLDRILADDFVHPVVTGQFLTKRQHIEWTVAHPPPSTRRARFERLDVRVIRDIAIATGLVVTEGIGAQPTRTIFTDIFARRGRRWRAISAQENDVVPIALLTETDPLTQEVERVLGDYFSAFELSEKDTAKALQITADGVAEDFEGIFSIPATSQVLLHFNKRSLIEGFTRAFELYRGKQPKMAVSNVRVLRRSDDEVIASYRMDFYLSGAMRNDAFAVTDLRRVEGRWRMYRHYEDKRR